MSKLYKYLISPGVTIISWTIFLLSPLFGIVRLEVLTNPDLNIFRIGGLSTMLFYAPFVISISVLVIMILWFREFAVGSLTDLHQKIFTVISILTVGFLIACQYLINIEYTNYPNYLYAHYGITIFQLQMMSFVASLQVMVFFAFNVYKLTYKPAEKLLRERLNTKSKPIFLENISLLVAIIGIFSLFILSGSTILEWPVFRRGLNEGYEGKVGVDYKYIKLLSDHTPKNINIIHPPQGNKWPAIGNQPVLRYFVFPRTLVSGALLTTQEFAKEIGTGFFVVIDPMGERKWPIVNTIDKTVIFDEYSSIKYKNLIVYFQSNVSEVYRIDF